MKDYHSFFYAVSLMAAGWVIGIGAIYLWPQITKIYGNIKNRIGTQCLKRN